MYHYKQFQNSGVKQYGFITDTLTLSKKLVEISKIKEVVLYMNDGTDYHLTLDAFSVDDDGNYVLEHSMNVLLFVPRYG